MGALVSESTLTTRINAARTAVGDSGGQQRLIRTFPREGVYCTAVPAGAGSTTAGRALAIWVAEHKGHVGRLPQALTKVGPVHW